MTTANKIKAIRARTGLSQAKFASRFKIPRRTLEAWEAGKRSPPDYLIQWLAAAVIAAERGVSLHDCFPAAFENPEGSNGSAI